MGWFGNMKVLSCKLNIPSKIPSKNTPRRKKICFSAKFQIIFGGILRYIIYFKHDTKIQHKRFMLSNRNNLLHCPHPKRVVIFQLETEWECRVMCVKSCYLYSDLTITKTFPGHWITFPSWLSIWILGANSVCYLSPHPKRVVDVCPRYSEWANIQLPIFWGY